MEKSGKNQAMESDLEQADRMHEIAVFNLYGTSKIIYVHDPSQWSIVYAQKRVWLQKLLVKWLHKLGLRWKGNLKCFTRTRIDGCKLMASIQEQVNAVWREYGHEPSAILMGKKNADELKNLPEIEDILSFDAGSYADFGHGMVILNIRVVVLPQLDGIIVLPQQAVDALRSGRE
jgi:hypothetical protein